MSDVTVSGLKGRVSCFWTNSVFKGFCLNKSAIFQLVESEDTEVFDEIFDDGNDLTKFINRFNWKKSRRNLIQIIWKTPFIVV